MKNINKLLWKRLDNETRFFWTKPTTHTKHLFSNKDAKTKDSDNEPKENNPFLDGQIVQDEQSQHQNMENNKQSPQGQQNKINLTQELEELIGQGENNVGNNELTEENELNLTQELENILNDSIRSDSDTDVDMPILIPY